MAGALEGIKVIDFGQYIAGPLCAMILADQGAEVLHIDPPGGPRMRTPANATWNRGKRCLELDLAQARDQEMAQAWLAQADVLIENFRPGVMQRLGWGQAELRARHPRLIYCSLPGFASDDPRSGWLAWEGVVAAATDTYRPKAKGEDPALLALPVASNFAAMQAATACVMALIARQRDGQGQYIEVPLFDAMFSLIGARGMSMPGPVQLSFDFTGFGIYRCSDGRDVHFAPVGKRFLGWFIDAAGVGHWREQGLTDRDRLASEPELAALLRRQLSALFLGRPSEHWQTLAAAAGAPLAVCHTMAEWLAHPHARQSGAVISLDDPQCGAMLQPGSGVRLSAFDALQPRPRRFEVAAPGLGWHTSTAATAPQTEGSSPKGPSRPGPLQGVRVLDLTQIWAGPTAARLLAEYGADVIKVNDPKEPILTHEDVNRGKRSLLLDLQSAPGQKTAGELIANSDVVLQNFARGVAERLGIGPAQARTLRPDIIYASVSAYGYKGPWGERRGYEVQAQACVGAQAQFGGPDGAQRLPYEVNDYGTGILAAFAIGLGLWHRRLSGSGQQVHAALSFTAGLHQSLYLHAGLDGRKMEAESDPLPGQSAWQSLYRASDGWLFLAVPPRDGQRQRALLQLLGISAEDAHEQSLGARIGQRLAEHTATHWIDCLKALDLGAHRLQSVDALMRDDWVRAHGLSLSRHHPGLGEVTTIGPVVRMSGTPLRAGKIASVPGADLSDVLAELADLRRQTPAH